MSRHTLSSNTASELKFPLLDTIEALQHIRTQNILDESLETAFEKFSQPILEANYESTKGWVNDDLEDDLSHLQEIFFENKSGGLRLGFEVNQKSKGGRFDKNEQITTTVYVEREDASEIQGARDGPITITSEFDAGRELRLQTLYELVEKLFGYRLTTLQQGSEFALWVGCESDNLLLDIYFDPLDRRGTMQPVIDLKREVN